MNPKLVYRLMREDNPADACASRSSVESDHRFQSHPQGLSESGPGHDPDGHRSTVAGRYHLHPAARRVRVPGGDPGRLLSSRDRLGAGSHNGRFAHADRAAHGAITPRRRSRTDPPFRSRCSQYASNDYTDLLKANGILVSMSRKGNPWDNAACESFMKTLKYEEVLRNEYRDLADARASIREFLEKVYNQKRLHSALGYLPPAEFEHNHKVAAARQLSL